MISIITVTLNSESSLPRTFESLKSQDIEFEYIVVDGASSDGTVEIIKSSEIVSDWISERDSGIYNAMNKGISKASGELIGIINSDDEYLKGALSSVKDLYLKSDGRSVIYGNMQVCYGGDHAVSDGDLTLESIRTGRYKITHPTMFVPKVLYDEHGGFDEMFRIAADRELVLRLSSLGVRFLKIEQPLAKFFLGGASSQKSLAFSWEQTRDEFTITRRHYSLLASLRISMSMFLRLCRNAVVSHFLSDHQFMRAKLNRLKD